MSMIEDLLEAYPDETERQKEEEEEQAGQAGQARQQPRELAPVRKPHTKKDFDRATRVKALQYRLSGMTYSQVADRLKMPTNSVRALIQYALRTAEADSVEEMRELENHRLDAMQRAIWPAVEEGDLQAVDRALKIAQTRAKLNGLEAPKKLELALSVRQEMEQALGHLEALVEGEVVPEIEQSDEDDEDVQDAQEVKDDDEG